MKASDLEIIARVVANAIKTHTASELARLRTELRTSGAGAPAVKWAGPWRSGAGYSEGAIVQKGGALYIASRNVAAGLMPHNADGDDSDDTNPWRLVAPRGRPGRDASTAALEQRVRALEQRR